MHQLTTTGALTAWSISLRHGCLDHKLQQLGLGMRWITAANYYCSWNPQAFNSMFAVVCNIHKPKTVSGSIHRWRAHNSFFPLQLYFLICSVDTTWFILWSTRSWIFEKYSLHTQGRGEKEGRVSKIPLRNQRTDFCGISPWKAFWWITANLLYIMYYTSIR